MTASPSRIVVSVNLGAHTRGSLSVVCCLLSFLLLSTALAQEERAAPAGGQINTLTQALLGLQKRARDLEAKSLERRRAAQERLDALAEEQKTLDRTVKVLSEQVTQLEVELAQKKEAATKDEKEAARLTRDEEAVFEAARRFVDRLEKSIDAGIPWMVEGRKDAAEKARRAISAPTQTPAKALSMAAALHESEEALGRSCEASVVDLELDGVERSVPALRLGLLAIAYSSEDGSVLGYVQRGQTLKEGNIETGGKEGDDKGREKTLSRVASGYRTAIDVLQRRLTPRVVDLYVPVVPLAGGEEEK